MVTLWDWLEDRDEPADVENTYHAGTKDAKVADGRSDRKRQELLGPQVRVLNRFRLIFQMLRKLDRQSLPIRPIVQDGIIIREVRMAAIAPVFVMILILFLIFKLAKWSAYRRK